MMERSGLQRRRDIIPSRTRGNNKQIDAGIGHIKMESDVPENVFVQCP